MKRFLIISFAVITSLTIRAQSPADSILWEKSMRAYVDALKADVQYNRDLLVSRMIESWKRPLYNVYDKEKVGIVRDSITAFLNDSVADYKTEFKEQANDIANKLDFYEKEAARMIAAFKITNKQMEDNLKYCNSASLVCSFSQMYLHDWLTKSGLASFYNSEIPYLKEKAKELKQIADALCNEKKATPDLLRIFFDMEYQISMSHKKEEMKR